MYQSHPLSQGLTISKRKTIAFFVAALFFLASLYIYPLYSSGDQAYYRRFYEAAIGEGFAEAFYYYQNLLSSSEPVYFLLVKLSADYIQKDTLMSFLNGALIYSLITWANGKRVSWLVIALLSLNFYLLVLLFSAERLKLAILFLMIAVNTNGIKKSIFAGAAFLSHAQTALLIVNWATLQVLPAIKSFVTGRLEKDYLKTIGILLISVVLFIPMMGYVRSKFTFYSETSGGLSELIKPIIFLALTLLYAHGQRLNAIVMHLPVLVAAFLVGSNRTVIFSYFIFLAFALQFRRGLNLGVLLTSVYFIFQGAQFLQKIFAYGDGFYGI